MSSWYQGWYFWLRLDEELIRSRCYGFSMSVIFLTLAALPREDNAEERSRLEVDLASVAESVRRRTDRPASLGKGDFAICLPQTESAGAATVLERLVASLATYQPGAGMATFPDNGTDAETLVGVATNEHVLGDARYRLLNRT